MKRTRSARRSVPSGFPPIPIEATLRHAGPGPDAEGPSGSRVQVRRIHQHTRSTRHPVQGRTGLPGWFPRLTRRPAGTPKPGGGARNV